MEYLTYHLYFLGMYTRLKAGVYTKKVQVTHELFPQGGDSHLKRSGMLVLSLRGKNQGFWSPLGCSGQNASIFCILKDAVKVKRIS